MNKTMIKNYAILPENEKAIYTYVKMAVNHSPAHYTEWKSKNGAIRSSEVDLIWAVRTPSGRISKTKWAYFRQRTKDVAPDKLNDILDKMLDKVNNSEDHYPLYNLPKGYTWVGPVADLTHYIDYSNDPG